MIHNAWTLAMGNSAELRDSADLLDKVDKSLVRSYRAKTGKSKEEIKNWMAAETWFTAVEAVDFGFVDRIAEAKAVSNAFNLTAYGKTPKALVPVEADDGENIEEFPTPDRAGLERRLALAERQIA